MLKDSGLNTLLSSLEDDIEENESYFAFRPFIDSGISLSIWNEESFLFCDYFCLIDLSMRKRL